MPDQQLSNAVTEKIKSFSRFNEEALYLFLAKVPLREYKDGLMKEALSTLTPEQVIDFEWGSRRGAGLYGPVSFLFGKVDRQMLHILIDSTRLRPTVEDGKGFFKAHWDQLKGYICDDWQYCEKRKQYTDGLALLTAIIAIAVEKLSWEVSLATAVVLLASYKGPKFICDCPDASVEGEVHDIKDPETVAKPITMSSVPTTKASKKGRQARAGISSSGSKSVSSASKPKSTSSASKSKRTSSGAKSHRVPSKTKRKPKS